MTLTTPSEPGRWLRVAQRCHPTLRYVMGTEAHVYALAVSASVLLAFYPFLIVMLSREYGMFHNSVTILLWSFVAAMVILAGAEWAARRGEVARPADRIS